MIQDNPAARLLSLIENGKKLDLGTNCRVAWQELLNVEDNESLLMSRLGKVMELPELTIQALQDNFPSQRDSWTYWSTQVNSGFKAQNINDNWATFINHIDSHSINYLRSSADLLQTKSSVKILDDETLRDIREKLNTIYLEIAESSLADEVKVYLVRKLRQLISSIDEYKIIGVAALLNSIDSTIGHAYLNPEYKNFLRDTELGKKLLDTLASMANVVTVAVGLPQLTFALAPLLGS
ncbi:hypothetical protein [uncultured Deefgea sp.]|uniref:hypothetical protein n=1 Tax=uncultured Deefgea sp. TaxID=1304914 RepID=UPI00259199D7|nr:hypothetical protein [uncultured Deefgea sp.]